MNHDHSDGHDHDHGDEQGPWTDPNALIDKAAQLGITIDDDQATETLAYLDAMLETNQHINLTAVRDREQAVVLHALDSLAFAQTNLKPHHAIDIGTGNGFPGVGVSVLHPHATVLLLDKTGKKIRAIGTCLVTSALDRIETIQLDASQAPALRKDFRHAFDLATARAVARPEAVAQLAEPLVRPGGHLALWLETEADTPERLGRFRNPKTHTYNLPDPAARSRKITVYERF